MKLLSDDEFVEGIIGGVGWIISIFFIRHHMKEKGNINIAILGLVTWALIWYIRKIGMNIYRKRKKIFGIKSKDFDIEVNKNPISHVMFDLFFLIMVIFVFKTIFPAETKTASKFYKSDIGIFIPILVLGLLVVFH